MVSETVTEIVHKHMNRKTASAFIKRRADENVPVADRMRFIEIAETEIMSLHEGNIARFRLRPSEFQAWKKGWH